MFVTTTTKKSDEGEVVTHRLHKDHCKSAGAVRVGTEDLLLEDPKVLLDVQPCGSCRPGKAELFSLKRQAETVIEKEKTMADKKATAKKSAAKKADAKPKAPAKPRTLAPVDGTQVCERCGRELPLTKFPTINPKKEGDKPTRGKVCREDLKKARDDNKAAREADKASKSEEPEKVDEPVADEPVEDVEVSDDVEVEDVPDEAPEPVEA